MVKLYNAEIGNEIFPIKDYNLYELEQAVNAGKVIGIADDGSLVAINLDKSPIEVEGNGIATLAEAFELGGEVKLLEDIVITEQVNCAKAVVLNLNGHNIIADFELASGALNVAHGGDLTVKGVGHIHAPKCYGAISMTQKGDTNDSQVARLVVEDGCLKGQHYAICGNGNPGRGNTSITINGGELGTFEETGTAIFNPQENSEVIINGGKIISDTGIEMRSGDLEVNGGEIVGIGIPATSTPNGNGTTSAGCGIAVAQHTTNHPINVVVNKGFIRGYSALYQSNPQNTDHTIVNMTVNGGVFNTINNGTVSVYSENKTGFINGGVFAPAADEAYMA